MLSANFWATLGLVTVLTVVFCCVMSLLAQQVRVTVPRFAMIFYRPLELAHNHISAFLGSARDWLSAQLAVESVNEGAGPLYFFIGAVLYTAVTAVFMLCDYGMVLKTFTAMGLEETVVNLPVDTSFLAAATLISAAAFWGMILLDLYGITHLAPWTKSLGEFKQKGFRIMAWFMFGLACFVALVGGLWRAGSLENVANLQRLESQASASELAAADPVMPSGSGVMLGGEELAAQLQDDSLEVAPSGSWMLRISLMGIAVLSIASTAASGLGLVILGKFSLLILITLSTALLLPLGMALWLCRTVANAIYAFLESLLELMISIGNLIINLLMRLFRGRAAENQDDGSRRGAQGDGPAGQTAQANQTGQSIETDPQDAGDSTGNTASRPDQGFNPYQNQKKEK